MLFPSQSSLQYRQINIYLARKRQQSLIPEALSELPESSPIPFTPGKLAENHNGQDIPVFRGHLTSSNLLFVRRFTYQNKGNLFLSLILAVHFQFALS